MFKLFDKGFSKIPFPAIEMAKVSFYEPNGFETPVKGKKMIRKKWQP